MDRAHRRRGTLDARVARMRFVFALLGLSVIGCGAARAPATTQTPPVALCGSAAIGERDGCVSVERIEGWLANGTYEIRDARSDGPSRFALTLSLPDGTSVPARFRRAPDGLESSDDHPRRQLAAYEVQKLFLDPARYLIAPTVFTCIPVETDAATLPDLAPHDGVDCALGVLSLADEGARPTGSARATPSPGRTGPSSTS